MLIKILIKAGEIKIETYIVTLLIDGGELNIKTKAENEIFAIEKVKKMYTFDDIHSVIPIEKFKLYMNELDKNQPKSYYKSNLKAYVGQRRYRVY